MQTELTEAIGKAAEQLGYTFHSGFAHRIGGELDRFPAAWLCPVEIKCVEGRYEGRIGCRVKLVLMRSGANTDAPVKSGIRKQLDEDALALYRRLCETKGIKVGNGPVCMPGEFAQTRHGDLSLEVSFDAEVVFSRERKWEE